jgi:hypothetical protein
MCRLGEGTPEGTWVEGEARPVSRAVRKASKACTGQAKATCPFSLFLTSHSIHHPVLQNISWSQPFLNTCLHHSGPDPCISHWDFSDSLQLGLVMHSQSPQCLSTQPPHPSLSSVTTMFPIALGIGRWFRRPHVTCHLSPSLLFYDHSPLFMATFLFSKLVLFLGSSHSLSVCWECVPPDHTVGLYLTQAVSLFKCPS